MICLCPAASADCRLSVSTSTVELLMTGLPAAAHATTVHLYTSVQLLHKLHNNLKNSKPACKCSFKHQCNTTTVIRAFSRTIWATQHQKRPNTLTPLIFYHNIEPSFPLLIATLDFMETLVWRWSLPTLTSHCTRTNCLVEATEMIMSIKPENFQNTLCQMPTYHNITYLPGLELTHITCDVRHILWA